MVKFIYVGTTEIAEEDIDNFMKAAEDLQIEGLQEKTYDDSVYDIENKLRLKLCQAQVQLNLSF